jgi:iron complex outermembrane receptor protein
LADFAFRLTGGLESDYSEERRQGGGATKGEKNSGDPLRNEDNIAESISAFLLGTFFVSERYTVTAGTRLGEVEFRSKDLIPPTTLNKDGSGNVRYSQFSPVFGVTRHMSQTVNVFANYGRGVETPTLAEVAYASRSSGTPDTVFNPTIRASKSDQAEVGLKWRPGRAQSLSATVFWVSTEDEIVTDQNDFGRSSFKNAPKTKRTGAELSWNREWSAQWRSLVTATMIDATYESAFSTNAGSVAAGKRIPGVPAHVAFAEIEWAQARNTRSAVQGWSVGLEAQSVGRRYANDTNTLSADSFETVALRSGYSRTVGATDLRVFARVDNLLNEKYVGSVIVTNPNPANLPTAAPFEPSPERNWMVGVKAVTRF